MKNEILAIIPARGGSKGVPRKNVRLLKGKPLMYYSIKVGLESKYTNRVVVSTDNEEIASVAKKYDAEVINRPKEISGDETPTILVLQHILKYLKEKQKYKPDIVVILQPTSPLRLVQDVDNCIEKLINEKCDSVMAVKRIDTPLEWMVKLDKNGKANNIFEQKVKFIRRQDTEKIYIPNGAVYTTWTRVIREHKTFKGPDTRAIVMPYERSIDIDTELDFYIAEKLMIENEGN